MHNKKTTLTYKIISGIVKCLYPVFSVEGTENLPDEPCLIVGNHCQLHGPLACEFYIPGNHYIWCAAPMMKLGEVPKYAFEDFWSQKPVHTRWFYKALSYLIAPLSVCIFNGAHTIPVYHDTRSFSTFRTTAKHLTNGDNVVIFPEYDKKHNNIIYDFRDKFIDIARLYYKKTGRSLSFVPLYIAPKLRKMYFGKPICFCPENTADEERQRIKNYLMEEITHIARELPPHTVVPYRNIPKKLYPSNKSS